MNFETAALGQETAVEYETAVSVSKMAISDSDTVASDSKSVRENRVEKCK